MSLTFSYFMSKGWFGNSKAHREAGRKGGKAGRIGKGWVGDSKRHAMVGRIGGSRPKKKK